MSVSALWCCLSSAPVVKLSLHFNLAMKHGKETLETCLVTSYTKKVYTTHIYDWSYNGIHLGLYRILDNMTNGSSK
jgi:hypothetical protein